MNRDELDRENELLNEAMDEYYEELYEDFLAGLVQLHQAWESLEMRLNIKFKENL